MQTQKKNNNHNIGTIMMTSNAAFENKTIFISRNLSPLSPVLIKFNQSGYTVHYESLITISQIRFTHTPKTQWIFFTSNNAIKHFFAQDPDLAAGIKFGVMSDVSAEYLGRYAKTADFIGTGVDITKIAKDFAGHIKDESFLFPQSIDSLQTIQKQLSFTNNCFNLFVYKTSIKPDFAQPAAALLIFTSPANVSAYFEKYKLLEDQKVIAIGSNSANKLRTYGISDIELPNSFDENTLVDMILERDQNSVNEALIAVLKNPKK